MGIETLLPKPVDTDAEAKGATDVAAKGVIDAKQAVKEVHPVVAGFTMEDPDQRNITLGLMGAAALAYYKRQALYHAFTGVAKDEGTVLSTADALRTNLQDKTKPLTASYRTAAGTGPHAQEMGDQFEGRVSARQGAAIETRKQSINQYGEIPGSAVKFEPVDNLYTRFEQLDPVKQKTAIDYMNAERELDMRFRIANQDLNLTLGKTPYSGAAPIGSAQGRAQYLTMVGRGLDEKKTAYGMFQPDGATPVPVSDLHAMVAAGKSDPDIKQVTDHFQDITDGMLKYMVEKRRLTPQEYTTLKRTNPNYYMTDLAEGQSHLGQVKITPGGGSITLGNPMEELPKYIDQAFRSTEWNGVRREYMDAMNGLAGQGNKFAKEIMGRKVETGGTHNADEVVYWRDAAGKEQTQIIKDPLVRQSLREGQSGGQLHILGGALGKLARLYESGAVGPLATLVGAPFAHTAALYSGVAGAAMRPSGVAAGWIDKGLQMLSERAIGRRVGLPGDLTLLGDMAYRSALGVQAVIAQRIAKAIDNSIVSDGTVAKMLSKPTAQLVSDTLTNHYKGSWVHTLQQEGILGPAGSSVDRSQAIADSVATMQKHSVPVQALKYTSSFIDDILHAVSSSPTASVLAMNKDLNKDKLGHVLRDLTGDPGKQGAFKGGVGKTIGEGLSATPWGNIYVQATEKLLREMRGALTSPTKFTKLAVGVTASVGLPQVTASLWNAGLGKDYTDYEYHVRSPEKLAGYIYVGLPGVPADQGLEIPVDPAMRLFKSAAMGIAATHLGLWDGSFFKPENADMADALKEMALKKGVDSLKAMVQQSFMPPVAPAVGAPLAAAGVNLQNYGDARNITPNKSKGFSESDGKDANAKFMGGTVPAQAEAVMRSLGASFAGVVYDTIIGTEKRLDQGQDTHELLSAGWKSTQQRIADSAKPVAGLFDHFMGISPSQESSATVMRGKTENMKEIGKAYQTMNPGGFDLGGSMVGNRQRGYTQLEGGPNGVAAADPEMNQLGFEVSKAYSMIEKTHLGQLNDMYANYHSVQNSTQFSPEKKRAMLNAQGSDIIQLQRMALTEVERMEYNLSKKYGRWINFDEIKMNRPITQFKPLLPQ